MDEYNLVDTFLDFSLIDNDQAQTIDLDKYNKIPFAALAGLGAGIAELIPQFRNIAMEFNVEGNGLFQAFNRYDGTQFFKLPFEDSLNPGKYFGNVQNGKALDLAVFKEAGPIKGNAVAAVNPAILGIGIAIAALAIKLDKIEKNQMNLMAFLESDKQTELKGTLHYLTEVFDSYKFNWNSDRFKQTSHVKTQDIKQEAEHNILFYQEQINSVILKKRFLASKGDIIKSSQKLINAFANYRIAVYLYSFSSLLEVLLLENYDAEYLKTLSGKIREFSLSYSEYYGKCFNWIKEGAHSSVESGVLKGLAVAADKTGKFINKIPVIERGSVDEALVAAGKKLDDYKDDSINNLLDSFSTVKNSSAVQFAQMLDTLSELHNSDVEMVFDKENLYVKAQA